MKDQAMDVESLKWVVGLFVTFVGAIATFGFAGYRSLANKMSAGHKDLHDRIDEVKDNYLRKDDFKTWVEPLHKDMARINEKLDRLIERDAKK